MKRKAIVVMNSVIVFAALLGLWQALVTLNHLPAYILPGPLPVAETLFTRLPSIMNSLLITTEEAAGGLIASILVGIAAAMVFAQWRRLRQLLYPYTILLQTVPIVAIAPLIIVWVGDPFAALVVCATIVAFFPVFANTAAGLASAPVELQELFRLYGAGRWRTRWTCPTGASRRCCPTASIPFPR